MKVSFRLTTCAAFLSLVVATALLAEPNNQGLVAPMAWSQQQRGRRERCASELLRHRERQVEDRGSRER